MRSGLAPIQNTKRWRASSRIKCPEPRACSRHAEARQLKLALGGIRVGLLNWTVSEARSSFGNSLTIHLINDPVGPTQPVAQLPSKVAQQGEGNTGMAA